MMQRQYLTAFCLLSTFLSIVVDGQADTGLLNDLLFINCLKHRNVPSWIKGLNVEERTQCLNFLKSVRTMKEMRGYQLGTSKKSPRKLLRTSSYSYLSAFVRWQNGDGSLDRLLLDRIAPCHRYSPALKRHWSHFFQLRRESYKVAPKILASMWSPSSFSGAVTFRPSANRRFTWDRLEGAELLIARQTSVYIGEEFGRYTARVFTSPSDNATDFIERDLHFGWQSSCPTTIHGQFMVLNLDVEKIRSWHRHRNSNLTMTVQINPQRQYFNPRLDIAGPVNVVYGVTGLILHFRRIPAEDNALTRSLLSSLFYSVPASDVTSTEEVTGNKKVRVRRSPLSLAGNGSKEAAGFGLDWRRTTNSPCELVPFKVRHHFTQNLQISWPEGEPEYWNIQECVGSCDHPLPSNIDSSNHAKLVGMHGSGRVCCVPTSYKSITYMTRIYDELVTDEISELIATNCGCR